MAAESSDIVNGTALGKYLLLVKGTKGKATVAVIQQTLENQNTYVFGELLDQANVKALAEGESKQWYDTLALFAYGTYSDYKVDTKKYIELSATLTRKLKQLSIVSMAAAQQSIPYDVLLKQLELDNVRELEDLIIDCMYSGVIQGKLDQKEQRFQVDWAMGRDIRPGQIEEMVGTLDMWVERSEALLKSIQEKITTANMLHEQEKQRQKEFEEKVETIKSNLKAAMAAEMVATDYDGMSEHFGFESSKGRRIKGGGKRNK